MDKIGENTEGVNNQTETNFGRKIGRKWSKLPKRGATGNYFDVYNDYKKNKKCCLNDYKIKNKKKKRYAENTALPQTATQKPTHKARRVAVFGSATVRCNKNKSSVR